MKQVIQLDEKGYFTGVTIADPSPLEPSVYLMPADTVDADVPTVPDGHLAKWDGAWVFEAIPEPEVILPPELPPLTWAQSRANAYPPMTDYLDGVVKGDQAQIDAYIAACLAVKQENPKP